MRAGHVATMPGTVRPRRTAALVLVGALACGCRREAAPPPMPPPEPERPRAAAPEPPAAAAIPPTLAALDRQATWVDRSVSDPLARARELEARDPPACTVEEACALVNDSPESNARIAAALFRPPEADTRSPLDRVTRHLTTDVASLNPLLAETAAEFTIAELTGLDLFGFDRDLQPFANAETVASWRSSADGLVDRVVLRPDLVWSDGRPVTAQDVAFSWRLLADPRVPARGFRAAAQRLRAVKAYDDRTVVFFHAEPLATNAWDIDFPVLPRHAYEATWNDDPSLVQTPRHAALEARPVTGGPYEVASRTRGGEIVLRRRSGWSTVRGRKVRQPPPVAEIRFRVLDESAAALEALAAGELDEAVLDPDVWAEAARPDVADRAVRVMAPEWHSLQVVWNLRTPLFNDRRVRRAMGYAIDHARLLDSVCRGLATPATGAFAPGAWAGGRRKVEPPRQDLATAEALLDEAGWVDSDGDGVRGRDLDGRREPCAFTILCDSRPLHLRTCELIRDSLARVGVQCTILELESAEFRDLLESGAFAAALVSWGTGVDPDAAADFWSSDGPRNDCGYASAEVDRLFAAGRRERDRQRRAEAYGRIEDILVEDQPCTWLVWRRECRGVSRRIGGDLLGIRGAVHWSPGLSSIWKPALE